MADGWTPEFREACNRYKARFGQPVYFAFGAPSIPSAAELIRMMDDAVAAGAPLGVIGAWDEPLPEGAVI
ncbi:MAG: hypothetical protein LBD51_03075 [Bifidobacteriaceae bacterium]|jgi:hypothetical protein|nr:hypothetical protein [Bifidobacteriaceae bacterium]